MNKLQTKIKKMKNKKGFTLIELIVVIVIIGILAAIAIPRLSGFSDKARKQADVATAKTIATAAMTLYAEDGTKADAVADLSAYIQDTTITPKTGGTFTLTWTNNDLTITNGTDTLYPAPAE